MARTGPGRLVRARLAARSTHRRALV